MAQRSFREKYQVSPPGRRAYTFLEAQFDLYLIEGVLSLEVGPALDMHRTKGYDMGIVLQLETAAHLEVFAKHPGHVRSVCLGKLTTKRNFDSEKTP